MKEEEDRTMKLFKVNVKSRGKLKSNAILIKKLFR